MPQLWAGFSYNLGLEEGSSRCSQGTWTGAGETVDIDTRNIVAHGSVLRVNEVWMAMQETTGQNVSVIRKSDGGHWDRRRLNRLADDTFICELLLLGGGVPISCRGPNSTNAWSTATFPRILMPNSRIINVLFFGFPTRLLLKCDIQNANISKEEEKRC